MVDEKSEPNYSVPALEKGLAVLELLAQASEALSLSQVAEMTENSTSQMFRTMNCLVERGYVIKDEISGKYVLTLKLFELANRHSPLKHLLHVANLPMQELAWAIRESCHISVIQQRQLLVVDQAESPEKTKLTVSVGASFPLVATVSGRLLLAALDEGSLNAILAEDSDYQQMSGAERARFWERIGEIRRTGFSVADDESYIGLKDTAVLVGNPDIGVMAAVAVTQLTATRKVSELEKVRVALRLCAKQINDRAGLSTVASQQTLALDLV